MKILVRLLSILVGVELLVAGVLCGLRLNSTRPTDPSVEIYTDSMTGSELLALPDRFLFDGPEKWRVLGETYLKFGFLHKAEACLQRAVESAPRSAEIAVLHGYCLDRLGQLDDAQRAFARAAQQGQGPVRETAAYFLGRVYLQREQPVEAADAFERAGDDHFPGLYQRAKLLVRSGKLAEAAPLVQRLTQHLPGEVRVWQIAARFADAVGQPGAAADAADASEWAHSLLPIHSLPSGMFITTEELGMARVFNQAVLQQRAGNKLGAAQRVLPLIRDETRWQNSNPWLLESVAAVHLEAGNVSAARNLLDRQITHECFPSARAWQLLGQVELSEKHPEQAWRAWSRAQFMNPATVDHEAMSRLAENRGDAEAARLHRGLAQQYAGIDALRHNKLDQAQAGFHQAVSIDSELPGAWFYLGEAERLRGAPRAAETAYRRCLELKPNHGRARARLERLSHQAH